MVSLSQARVDGECSVPRVHAADFSHTFAEVLTHCVDGLSQVAAVFGSAGILPAVFFTGIEHRWKVAGAMENHVANLWSLSS
jgi:hypothetical protein